MTAITIDTSPEQRLIDLGISLPNVPTPIANFVPFRCDSNRIFLAGQICEWNGEVVYRGKLGMEHELQDGQDAARICALNLLAALRLACGGSLDRVTACLRVGGISYLARCEMNLNVTTWKKLRDGCPTASNQSLWLRVDEDIATRF